MRLRKALLLSAAVFLMLAAPVSARECGRAPGGFALSGELSVFAGLSCVRGARAAQDIELRVGEGGRLPTRFVTTPPDGQRYACRTTDSGRRSVRCARSEGGILRYRLPTPVDSVLE